MTSDSDVEALRTALFMLTRAIREHVPDPHWSKIVPVLRVADQVRNANCPAEVFRFVTRNQQELLKGIPAGLLPKVTI